MSMGPCASQVSRYAERTAPRPLGLDEYVAPGYWDPEEDFEEAPGFSAEREFDLIAPLAVYCDTNRRIEEAASAFRKLKRAQHPLVVDVSWKDAAAGEIDADVFQRYNALLWRIAADVLPGIEAVIDAWGGWCFHYRHHRNLLHGECAYLFALHPGVRDLRRYLDEIAAASGLH